ncbi:MAG: TonB family protein [Deltaproteobacteria bacterium]|nr:TonB family protein [Deltaproteobacteria bacterium]MCB9788104.1 TonB family protein [Deltaproteobacteria bacterium]
MRILAAASGLVLTLVVHVILVAFLYLAQPSGVKVVAGAGGPRERGSVGYGLCGERRCSVPETAAEPREPEPDPANELEVLEAALMPALGAVEPEPDKLPELQTYEQPEIIEDGINLDKDNPPPEEVKKKEFDPEPAKRDPKRKDKKLEDILKDFDEDDPRKRATSLDRIIGHSEGEVGGQGTEVRAGNMYGMQMTRALRKVFVVPPFLDEASLKKLRMRVVVERISAQGEILSYKVDKPSGNRAFDDAALDAVRQFVPSEGGSKSFPAPDPDVLRDLNARGIRIDLDGRFASR